jgi:CheY-like chemotaxis protein
MPPERFTILIMDDSENAVENASLILTLSGFHVIPTTSAQSVFDICHREIIDLVTTDIVHPGIDGFDLVKVLRSDPELPYIPCAIISASMRQEGYAQRAFEAGADAIMLAPFDPDDFLAMVIQLLPVDPAKLR